MLRVTAVDARGTRWASRATFVANHAGVIDPTRVAPLRLPPGSYHGVKAMGLIESMEPSNVNGYAPYLWGPAPQSFAVTATVRGRSPVSRTVERSVAASGVTVTSESLASVGFVGAFYQPAPGTAKQPALLVFGGSGGGLPGGLPAALFASRGYPTLAVAYFGAPGLPTKLANIPLEYFQRALVWLAAQPGVDAKHVYVLSASRGTEAAMLLGAYFPSLVAGVIASVPSNVANCSFPTGCSAPAWTLNGQALPFTTQFNNPVPTDNPAAVIPVERIRGPILIVCAGTDRVWDSCVYAQAIMTRLGTSHDPQPRALLAYQNGGHGIAGLVAYEPGGYNSVGAIPLGTSTSGAEPDANSTAVEQLWPRVLAFLAHPASVRSS